MTHMPHMPHMMRTMITGLLAVGLAATVQAWPAGMPAAQDGARAASPRELLRELKEAVEPERAEKLRARLQRAWIDAGPMSAQVLLKQAARAQAAGLVDTAEQLLRLAARRWPEYAEARFRLAFLLWQRGRTGDALRQLDALLRRLPDHFPAASLKMRLLLEQKRQKEALRTCQALLRGFPHWREMRRRCERLRWRLEQDV